MSSTSATSAQDLTDGENAPGISFDDTVASVSSQDTSSDGEGDKVSEGGGGGLLIIKGGPYSNRRPKPQKQSNGGFGRGRQQQERGSRNRKPGGTASLRDHNTNHFSVGALPAKPSAGYKNTFYQSMADETVSSGLYHY